MRHVSDDEWRRLKRRAEEALEPHPHPSTRSPDGAGAGAEQDDAEGPDLSGEGADERP